MTNPENVPANFTRIWREAPLRLALAALLATGTCLVAAAQSAKPDVAPAAQPAAFTPGPQAFALVKTPAGRAQFVQTYCLACHNARAKAGGLVLEGVDTVRLTGNDEIWEKVIKRLGAGEMPPRTAPRHPDPAVAHAMVAGLIGELDGAAKKQAFAGRTVIRRLNRTEYGNAVRDLLDVDFPFAADLPMDGTAVGFDNIADSLSMSPLLLESYLKVGRRVSELAVGEGDPSPVTERYPATKSQAVWQGEGMPFETRGGVLVKKYFPRDGEYDLRAFLNDTALTPTEGVRFFHSRIPVKAGLHTFIVTFPQSNAEREGPIPNLAGAGGRALGGPLDIQGSAVRPHLLMLLDGKRIKDFEIAGPNSGEAIQERSGPPTLARAEITGPYNAGPPAETPSRARVLLCRPKLAAQEQACANRILATLLRRAWRRDVNAADLKPFLATYSRERASGTFPTAIAAGLRDILVSPGFLFRLEFDPSKVKPGDSYRINDFDLASRLSFFIWSSIPDDRLLDIAAKGQLHDAAVLDRETRRLLGDPRADALIDNFAAQWLSLRDVQDAKPDGKAYPQFDVALRDSFETETRLFLRSIMRENRGVMDVVNSHYTFVNDRLAEIYGIPNITGPGFRRVELPADSPRGGILGMGSILMVTSHANKTSPVLRGKWILTNLLDSPPHPPPAGVPPLDVSPVKGRILTTREQVERHRANAVCATCHSRMDPYGFSLENFDVIGRWRDKDEGGKVDATASLVNGQTFTGPSGLRQMLGENSDQFVGATVSRMMTYALGRPVDAGDMPAVRGIVAKTAPGAYKFNDIVLGVVHSAPFQMKQAAGGPS